MNSKRVTISILAFALIASMLLGTYAPGFHSRPFQPIPQVYATGTPIPVNEFIADFFLTGSHSAWLVIGDYTDGFHTSATKCGGVGTPVGRDSRSLGFLMGPTAQPQNLVLDTNANYVSQSTCGQPLTSVSQAIVTLGGSLSNEVENYYTLSSAQSIIYYNSGTGCINRRDGGSPNPISCTTPSATTDTFVIEAFKDSTGRPVYLFWAMTYLGSMASTEYFTDFIEKSPTTYTSSWYVYQWTEGSGVSANSLPDAGDTFTQLAAGPSSATIGQSLTNAINLGVAWLNRHYAPIGSTGYYAVRDHSAVPIYIQDTTTGEVRMAGDQTGQNDYSMIPTSSTTANGQQYEIDFETGTDWNHDDIKLNVTYLAVSPTQVQARITMLYYTPDNGHNWAVYLAGIQVASGNWVGQTKIQTSPVGSFGWNSFRYVHRHTQRLAEHIYAGGVDLTKGLQLAQLMTDTGFSTDIYDPMFFSAGVGSNALPATYGLWDRTWWDEYPYWSGKWDGWFPKGLGGANAAYPYKSRILGAPNIGIWQSTILPNSPLYAMSQAVQLMAIGSYSTFDRAHVKSLLDSVHWDGNGIQGDQSLLCGGNHPDATCISIGGYPYSIAGYQTYNLAYFLVAATLYGYYGPDTTYQTYADQAAVALLQNQALSQYVNTVDYGLLNRPDVYGGFYTGYHASPGIVWKDTGSHGILEDYWWLMQSLGWFTRMGPETALPIIASGESTPLSTWALQVYKAWRFNNDPSTFPWDYNDFKLTYTDCSGAGSGSICEAYSGGDVRLKSISNGATATAYASVKVVVGVAMPSSTTLTAHFFNRGVIDGYTNPGSLSVQMRIWTAASGGSLVAQSNWITIHSYTGNSPQYEDAQTVNWSPGVQINSGYVVELLFSAQIGGGPDPNINSDWAVNTYILTQTDILNNMGFVHIGYLELSSPSLVLIAYGG